jgi:DNA-directed RNA polymerase subunit RPC12/RpoP
MHKYRCVACGREFEVEDPVNRCPFCRGKVLFHLEGRPVRKKGNCGGNCSGCSGCAA